MALKKRNQSPPFSVDYRTYKQFLRIDFSHRCAYCDTHEAEDGGSGKFHIDHYKPKKRFPSESSNYLNLFYSCSRCNIFKSDFWPTPLMRLLQHFILNPCNHDFDQHYDRTNPEWVAKTKAAIWNINRLRLNAPQRIQLRKDRTLCVKWIDDLERQKKQLQNCLMNIEPNGTSLQKHIENIQDKIDTLRRKIETPLD